MITLEQQSERLLRVNESDSDKISLFREINAMDGKCTLVRTFTVDDITPQGVIDAVIKDSKKANFKNINDYIALDVFDSAYKKASDNIDTEDGVGRYNCELDGNDYTYFLCVGNDINNRDILFVGVTLFIEVFARYDAGDCYEYGGVYGEGWYINDDQTDVNIRYDCIYDHEDLLVDNSLVTNKIREVVDGLL